VAAPALYLVGKF